MNLDLEAMKAAAARAATQRPWHRQQVGAPGYYNIMVGENERLPMSGDAGRANSAHIVAAQPAAVLALIERLERAERNRDMWKGQSERQAEALRKQATAAAMGMDAAKAHGAAMERSARTILAQSNPDALESERAANAMLTEENDRLQKALDAARAELRQIYLEQAEAVGWKP